VATTLTWITVTSHRSCGEIRGPYQPIADGVAAYEKHVEEHGEYTRPPFSGRADPAAYVVTTPGSPAGG
jgi:hypothetical protein